MTQRSVRAKRLVRLAGLTLLALSLLFVAREVSRHRTEIASWQPEPGDLLGLAGLAAAYAAMLYLLAEVWHHVVGVFGRERRRRTWRAYALTQIARYLPGNVAHLLGRALVLRDGPLSDAQLGLATLLELALVPLGAVLALVLLVPWAPDAVPLGRLDWSPGTMAAVVGLGALAASAAAWTVRKRIGLRRLIRGVARALPFCVAFMIGLGAIFGTVVVIVGEGPFLTAGIAGILAWLVGYAVPGAPGGLGPREAALVLMLSGTVPPGELMISVVAFRLVTVLGDVLCFALGALLLRSVPAMQPRPRH